MTSDQESAESDFDDEQDVTSECERNEKLDSSNEESELSSDESNISLTEVTEEREEVTSYPGKSEFNLQQLTRDDISRHNLKYSRCAVWWKHGNDVYNVRRLYIRLLPLMLSYALNAGLTELQFYKQVRKPVIKGIWLPYQTVLYAARRLRVPEVELAHHLNTCHVGRMWQATWRERCDEISLNVSKILEARADDESECQPPTGQK